MRLCVRPDCQHRTFEYLKQMDEECTSILLGEIPSGLAVDPRVCRRRGRGPSSSQQPTNGQRAGSIIVGEEESFSETDWVRRIGRAAAWSGEVLGVPEEQLPDHSRNTFNWRQHIIGDTSKISAQTGFPSVRARGGGDGADSRLGTQPSA